TSWNQGAQRLFGYTAQEIVGKPLSLLVPPDHPDELPSLLERIKKGEHVDHFETVRLHKNGSRGDVSLTISPVKNAEGKIIGASKIARDITARKRHEATLHFLAEASKLLGELLDVPSTLQKVAGVAVPYFADGCAVDLLEADGSLRRVAIAHVDPAMGERAHALSRRYPTRPLDPYGPAGVARTGQPELASEVPDVVLGAVAHDEDPLRLLRELRFRSYLSVPLVARGRPLGVLTFSTSGSGRRYGPADLTLAK